MALWGYGCPYHEHSGYPLAYAGHPMAVSRSIPQMLTMTDRLFDALDSMFEVPSSWLEPRGEEQKERQPKPRHTVEMVNTDDQFKINLHVDQFKPEQLSVKCVKDRFIVVNGKRDVEKDTEGLKQYVTQEFTRTFVIPRDVDVGQLKSNVSKDGVLSIEALKKQLEEKPEERMIAIEHAKN